MLNLKYKEDLVMKDKRYQGFDKQSIEDCKTI